MPTGAFPNAAAVIKAAVAMNGDPQVPFPLLLQTSRLLSPQMWVGIHADGCLMGYG
jgi:hypothetical protein